MKRTERSGRQADETAAAATATEATLSPLAAAQPAPPPASAGAQNTPTANNNRSSFMAEGEVLRFDRISRYDMGFYMCIASNGVPPSVTQQIFVPVSCKCCSFSLLLPSCSLARSQPFFLSALLGCRAAHLATTRSELEHGLSPCRGRCGLCARVVVVFVVVVYRPVMRRPCAIVGNAADKARSCSF